MDLWPNDFEKLKFKAPTAILAEQASKLGEKTKNLVQAEIRRLDKMARFPFAPFDLCFSFVIVAPTLDYRYELFAIGHKMELYPMQLILEEDLAKEFEGQPFQDELNYKYLNINDEGEFIEALKKVFSSTKVRKVVGAIMAQTQGS